MERAHIYIYITLTIIKLSPVIAFTDNEMPLFFLQQDLIFKRWTYHEITINIPQE